MANPYQWHAAHEPHQGTPSDREMQYGGDATLNSPQGSYGAQQPHSSYTTYPGQGYPDYHFPSLHHGSYPTGIQTDQLSPRQSSIMHNLPTGPAMYAEQSTSSPDTRMISQHPMERFVKGDDQPWDPSKLVQSSAGSSGARDPGYMSLNPAAPFGQYREPVRTEETESDVTGHITGRRASHISATRSDVISSRARDTGLSGQDCSDVTNAFESMRPGLSRSRSSSNAGLHAIDNQSPSETNSTGDHVCPHCGQKLRLRSEFKKHLNKHEKPHKCDQPKCSRRFSGFTTSNDLDRHKRSVHGIYPTGGAAKVYICASDICGEKNKLWPRLDNFKQHVDRMHKGEDVEDLVRRSEKAAEEGKTLIDQQGDPYTYGSLAMGANRPNDGLMRAPTLPSTPNSPRARPYSNRFTKSEPGQSRVQKPNRPARPTIHGGAGSFRGPIGSITGSPPPMTPSTPATQSQAWQSGSTQSTGTSYTSSSPVIVHQPNQERQNQELAYIAQVLASQCASAPDGSQLEDELYEALSTITSPTSSSLDPQSEHMFGQTLSSLSVEQRKLLRERLMQENHPQHTITGAKNQCQLCQATFNRPSDLRKHMRRHERPFGCTFETCLKQFGSKNDWKRHENSQHCQEDQWRCEEKRIEDASKKTGRTGGQNTRVCAKVFSERSHFRSHLRKHHGIKDEVVLETRLKEQHICYNNQGSFWCGFCRKIRHFSARMEKAWDERFDHIGHHFTKENHRIDEWLLPCGTKTKGDYGPNIEYLYEQELEKLDDDDAREDDMSSSEESCPEALFIPPEPTTAVMDIDETAGLGIGMVQEGDDAIGDPDTTLVSGTLEDPPLPEVIVTHEERRAPLKRKRENLFLYCCQCNNGPYIPELHVSCVARCGHQLCSGCYEEPAPDEGLDEYIGASFQQ